MIDGKHRYSTDASHARRDVLIGIRALKVEILDAEGTSLAVHPRTYGRAVTSSEDRWRCFATGRTSGATASCGRCCPTRCANGSTCRTRRSGAGRCRPSNAWTGNPAGPTRSRRCSRSLNRPAGRTGQASRSSRPGSRRA